MVVRYNRIEELFNEEIAMEQGKTECAPLLTNLTDCEKCHASVKKLQLRIVKALEARRYNKAKALQHILDNSLALNCVKLLTKEPVFSRKKQIL